MKSTLRLVSIAALCVVMTSCQSLHRKDYGMIAGGVAGGAAGHVLTGGSAVGTVAGAVGGAYVGRQLTH